MNFENNIKQYIDAVNKKLEGYLSPKYPEDIYKAMGYSVFAGGKRVRPVLMLAACEAFGGNIKDVLPYACGLEMIHTYSLIHDDLPAMDNDVRFLPNPYYIEELRPMSGNDQPVRDYVMNNDTAKQFLTKLTDMVEFLIPNYISEGKTQLVIGIGCTGGKHRSVTLANELYEALKKTDSYGVRIEHRDIGKDAITKAK